MHKFFTPSEYIVEDLYGKIVGEDVKHIYKVLRLQEGEKVVLNDCNGNEYLARIKDVSKTEVNLDIIEKLELNNESDIEIVLFQGMPKAQKMDLIVQKGTELGISKFIPLITERVDVKLKGDFKKLDRLNRIALEACKQSKRSIIPEVLNPITLEELIKDMRDFDLIIVPYENKEDYGIKSLIKDIDRENIKRIGIVVGPEGGFEEDEISKLKEEGAHIITLGKRILRTETAGFVATSLLQYELGDLGGII
ncbi:16S rRNA (uracil(1498)-N(3))-methyltransferase [Clostridium baratii]|uniref:16S rRNA (uracil(1498)-N(3))-methyltransferase n=1 Tax=Clostridium baratii TaxID=1561 RepID=UPI002433149C|nr:16S rRNA (uracil(1498)-N(3))-methyltransferase [Clostridium baratii]MBS6043335.1 16S rRNA (uracil(1498)-N(3))-methyltransferase [Clostridium baratii]